MVSVAVCIGFVLDEGANALIEGLEIQLTRILYKTSCERNQMAQSMCFRVRTGRSCPQNGLNPQKTTNNLVIFKSNKAKQH